MPYRRPKNDRALINQLAIEFADEAKRFCVVCGKNFAVREIVFDPRVIVHSRTRELYCRYGCWDKRYDHGKPR